MPHMACPSVAGGEGVQSKVLVRGAHCAVGQQKAWCGTALCLQSALSLCPWPGWPSLCPTECAQDTCFRLHGLQGFYTTTSCNPWCLLASEQNQPVKICWWLCYHVAAQGSTTRLISPQETKAFSPIARSHPAAPGLVLSLGRAGMSSGLCWAAEQRNWRHTWTGKKG